VSKVGPSLMAESNCVMRSSPILLSMQMAPGRVQARKAWGPDVGEHVDFAETIQAGLGPASRGVDLAFVRSCGALFRQAHGNVHIDIGAKPAAERLASKRGGDDRRACGRLDQFGAVRPMTASLSLRRGR